MHHKKKKADKVVVAYSGGLDTSVIIKWLLEFYECNEVIAFYANLGQKEDTSSLTEKAINTGASKLYNDDLKEEFVRDFVFEMLKANAVYEGYYLLGTSIARPLIAKRQIEIAKEEGADTVCHGATGKGNDQVRFELTYLALNPKIKIIAPWREWNFKSRTSLINYAKEHNIPVTATVDKPFSMDENLFHISYEGGLLENPWQEPTRDMYKLAVPIEEAPDKVEYIEVSYEKGIPVAVNDKKYSPAALLEELNAIGGRHGIGRVDIVENRYVGMKSRGVYETPGGTILHHAHRAVESITMDREVMHLRDSLIPEYSKLIYYGYWFSPEMGVLRKMVDETQMNVTGVARLKLYKGNCVVVGRKAADSLYREDLATFEEEEIYDQRDAQGFINLNALRLKLNKLK